MAKSRTATTRAQASAAPVVEHPWMEKLGRIGYATRGIIYLILGVLAAQAAIGAGGPPEGTEAALGAIVSQPFGQILLVLVGVGLVGYALWRGIEASFDPGDQGGEERKKQLAHRVSAGISAVSYGALAVVAFGLALGTGGGGGNSTRDWTAQVLAQPFGQWLVGLAGLAVVGGGLAFLYEAFKAKFFEKLETARMDARVRTWAKRLGQFGIAARGVVFVLIGGFLALAAWRSDPSEAGGLAQALQVLASQPFGWLLLGIVALGLAAYGLYSALIEARFRRMA